MILIKLNSPKTLTKVQLHIKQYQKITISDKRYPIPLQKTIETHNINQNLISTQYRRLHGET